MEGEPDWCCDGEGNDLKDYTEYCCPVEVGVSAPSGSLNLQVASTYREIIRPLLPTLSPSKTITYQAAPNWDMPQLANPEVLPSTARAKKVTRMTSCLSTAAIPVYLRMRGKSVPGIFASSP